METLHKKSSSYRPEIDGLRALAVIAVIINHLNKEALPSGFLGVDIFFVISGFVVTSSLANKPDQSWKDYLLTFYSRRVKRLIPALVTCVIITSLIGCLFIYETRASLRTGMASLVGLSNLYLFNESTDYFGSSAEFNLFTQTWSLGVEEQFYLVFPILLGLCGFSRRKQYKGGRNVFFTVTVLSILSLIIYVYLAETNFPAAFFLMPARFWELGAGCLTFFAARHLSSSSLNRIKSYLAPISIWIIIGILFLPQEFNLNFPSRPLLTILLPSNLQTISTILLTLFSCILVWSLDKKGFIHSFFSSKSMVKIGSLSYSLYLWHWSIIVVSRWTIGVSKWTIPIQLILMVSISVTSYYLIEKPLRHIEWSKVKLKTIGYGLTAIGTSLIVLIGLEYPLKGTLYTGNDYPEAGVSSFKLNKRYKVCKDASDAFTKFSKCSYPPLDAFSVLPKTIYFVGDSHAGALQALANLMVQNNDNIRIIIISTGACLFSESYVPQPRRKMEGTMLARSEKCIDRNKAFLSELLQVGRSGDLVISVNRYRREFIASDVQNKDQEIQNYSTDLDNISSKLSSKGISLVLFNPLPQWNEEKLPNILRNCQNEWFKLSDSMPKDCELSTASELKAIGFINESFRQLTLESSNVYSYNPFPLFCDSTKCSLFSGEGVPLFRDPSHLNNYGAEHLYDDFIKFLQENALL